MQDFIPYEHAVALKQNAHAVKGIYITEEAKKELEAKVAELEKSKMILQRAVSTDPNFGEMQRTAHTKYCTEVDTYKEILSSAVILPVEESWADFNYWTTGKDCPKDKKTHFPNGVIIEKKMP
jgi:hypothetical protein